MAVDKKWGFAIAKSQKRNQMWSVRQKDTKASTRVKNATWDIQAELSTNFAWTSRFWCLWDQTVNTADIHKTCCDPDGAENKMGQADSRSSGTYRTRDCAFCDVYNTNHFRHSKLRGCRLFLRKRCTEQTYFRHKEPLNNLISFCAILYKFVHVTKHFFPWDFLWKRHGCNQRAQTVSNVTWHFIFASYLSLSRNACCRLPYSCTIHTQIWTDNTSDYPVAGFTHVTAVTVSLFLWGQSGVEKRLLPTRNPFLGWIQRKIPQ